MAGLDQVIHSKERLGWVRLREYVAATRLELGAMVWLIP